MEDKMTVVYTNKAVCRDCYRCIRACPVAAIKIKDNQASVIPEKCIACGTCINECPQDAKTYRNDIEKLKVYIDSEAKIAFGIAPSFASVFDDWEIKRLAFALRELGAVYVGETAIGAFYTAREVKNAVKVNNKNINICTACPAINSYIETYIPSLIPNLITVNSPMIAHAKLIKEKYKDVKFIFIGPCTAKKEEADRHENKNIVDVVLSFEELKELLNEKNINLKQCEEGEFDEVSEKNAKLFPLEGGLLKTAGLSTDTLSSKNIIISGIDEVKDVLENIKNSKEELLIEPLFCKHGCINGPLINSDKSNFSKRNKLFEYSESAESKSINYNQNCNFTTSFSYSKVYKNKNYSEEQIQQALADAGKSDTQKQLNCGACGYKNCREQIIAVLDGIANPEMCIPYMRRLAENKSDLIITSDPNGVVVLDKDLKIISMNPAFKKMFYCSDSVHGKKISYLFDPEPFEQVLLQKDKVIRKKVKYDSYNLICHQTHYAINESNQVIGIFADITKSELNSKNLRNIKRDTVLSAQDLIEHQIEIAQQMAKFLGESTAKGEMLLNNFIDTLEDK